jgi:hypothetical protein
MTTTHCRRALAALLVPITAFVLAGGPVWSAGGALFTGRVLESDRITPRTGVVVALYDAEAEATYRSHPTTVEGVFRIESAPAGSYALLTETPEGVYLGAEDLVLAAGRNRPLALTLSETAPNLAPAQSSSSGGLPTWAKGVIAGVIGVFGVLLIVAATEDEDTVTDF